MEDEQLDRQGFGDADMALDADLALHQPPQPAQPQLCVPIALEASVDQQGELLLACLHSSSFVQRWDLQHICGAFVCGALKKGLRTTANLALHRAKRWAHGHVQNTMSLQNRTRMLAWRRHVVVPTSMCSCESRRPICLSDL